jgi:glycosyltransferase involved in cell wall biosynthesis
VAYVGSCLPRRCGIATFTANLNEAVETRLGKNSGVYIALNDTAEGYNYATQVIGQIVQEKLDDYRQAANLINTAGVDLVSLQHEFGLFGGPAGNYITEFLSRMEKPVVTTLHTVLEKPTPDQRKTLIEIAAFSQSLVVMNALAIDILTTVYKINAEKIRLIPHGVPDTPYIDPLFYKHQLGFAGREVVLTFGFLSPNKGIETMLQALPPVVEKHPEVLYIVLGVTHPVVKKQHGEAYRESLEKMVKELDLQKHVLFQNEFVDDETLDRYLGAADLVVCPYHSGEQITSGVLSIALGKGKAVISTPYLHAREVLSGGRGRLVDFKDHAGFTTALCELLGNKTTRREISRKSLALGQEMTWSKVAQQYTVLFEQAAWEAAQANTLSGKNPIPTLPAINLQFLRDLTEDTGIMQHSIHGVAEYSHGYTTDDAARALVACTYYHNLFYSDPVLPLIDRYLAFIVHARQKDGWFANFMNYERAFTDKESSEDTLGRCLWGLGATVRLCQSDEQDLLAKKVFEESLPLVDQLTYTRSLTYAALGLGSYLHSYPEAQQVREELAFVADKLLSFFEEHASPEWPWFEPFLTYDNARLPQALLLAYHHLSREEYLATALQTLDFLTATLYREGYFDLVGNQGWFFKGGEKANFGQQPLDAGALVETYLLAFILSGKEKYLELCSAAFQWFLGRNQLGKSLYFPECGACADGLDSHGVSKNRGAESTITFLIALLTLYYWELRNCSPCL